MNNFLTIRNLYQPIFRPPPGLPSFPPHLHPLPQPVKTPSKDPTPPYAVLFKTHFWDDFVDSQFRQLQSRAGTDELFVVVDETPGPVPAIPHEKVLRITEDI